MDSVKETVQNFSKTYQGRLNNAQTITEALNEYQVITVSITHIGTFASLHLNADQSDEVNLKRMGEVQLLLSDLSKELSFLNSEIIENDESVLNEAISLSKSNVDYLKDVLRNKPLHLGGDIEKLLTSLSPVFDSNYGTYNRANLADMSFQYF